MALIPTAISIPLTIEELTSYVVGVRRKTTTLVDYYIYPNPTPSEISAYDPRLAQLHSRLKQLSAIDYVKLAYLLDASDALSAAFLLDIIDQLLNAIHGIQEIFENHYDRYLEERKPYATIYQVLELREKELKRFTESAMLNYRQLRPEDLRPNGLGYFCRGAIQMINKRDQGRISYVDRNDLLEENRARMKTYGGAMLWWQCSECSFRLRYHISNSSGSSIHSTEEIRDHSGVKAEYRSRFLVKCHLFQPSTDLAKAVRGTIPKYGCVFCYGTGKPLDRGSAAFSTGRELAMHVAEKHKKPLPPGPMAEKFNVALGGKLPPNVARWDINLK